MYLMLLLFLLSSLQGWARFCIEVIETFRPPEGHRTERSEAHTCPGGRCRGSKDAICKNASTTVHTVLASGAREKRTPLTCAAAPARAARKYFLKKFQLLHSYKRVVLSRPPFKKNKKNQSSLIILTPIFCISSNKRTGSASCPIKCNPGRRADLSMYCNK